MLVQVSARDTYPTGSGHPVTAACDTNAAFSLAILAIVARASSLSRSRSGSAWDPILTRPMQLYPPYVSTPSVTETAC